MLVGDSPSIYSLDIATKTLSGVATPPGIGPYRKINFDNEIGNIAILNDTHVVLFVEEPKPTS